MDRMKGIRWRFDYNNKHYINTLRDMNSHGDFLFKQNNTSFKMDQIGERYFLPMLIYGMQKIKSPEEAKRNLENKDYIQGEGFEVSYSNEGAYWYYQPIFTIFDEFNEYTLSGNYERNAIVKITDSELRVIKDEREEIILPYSQLSKTIDKLIIASKNAFFRTDYEDLSKMIDYYVSGEFEKYHKYILSFSKRN